MRVQRLFAILLLTVLWATVCWADVYCPACGARYPDSYNYCPKDGFDLAEARKAAGTEASQEAPATEAPAKEEAPAREAAPKDWPQPGAGATPAGGSRPAEWPEAAPKPRQPAASADWATDLPLHLPSGSPDANVGDYALYEWSESGAAQTTIYFRAVLKKSEKGRIEVVCASVPGAGPKAEPLSLTEMLSRIGPQNARREAWSDYRDFVASFRYAGAPLRSPFVGGEKPAKVYRKDYPIPRGVVGTEVAEYPAVRGGKKTTHLVRTSDQVPYAFVESVYQRPAERLRLYLFGTLDEDELAPLERAFPAVID